MVGPALASIPAILLSLLLPDPFPRTFWIIIYFIAVQMVESNILGPRIVGHAVGLHPVASILALIIGAQLFGAFGALLATPIVAAAWVVIASLYRSVRGETADQMLAQKRPGWVIRSPEQLLPMRKRINAVSRRPNRVVDLEGPAQRETGSEAQAQPENLKTETTRAQVKGTSIHLDHIDLLRPVPDAKEPALTDEDEGTFVAEVAVPRETRAEFAHR